MIREDGFYWGRRRDYDIQPDYVQVFEWFQGRWLRAGADDEYEDNEIEVLSERLVPPPARACAHPAIFVGPDGVCKACGGTP